MESKIKYQYTYFIKPFLIKENTYQSYLLSLLKNKNFNVKIFEKERDFNIYSFFLQNVREYFFPSFSFSKEKIKKLKEINNNVKAGILSKCPCNIFEYSLERRVQGKIIDEDGIFFNIDKIEIICLNTGICFFVIKTNIDNTEKFSDLLNFNYKFKDINSEYSNLKSYNNIKIQTNEFDNATELSDFIDNIIGVNNNTVELQNIDLYNKRFFVYSYCCIDQENWNTKEDIKNIEDEFLKFSNVLSNNNTLEFNYDELKKSVQKIDQFKFARFGFTKQSSVLMASNIDINNYTSLLYDYENSYLYTLIITLYQRVFLKKQENDFKNNKNLNIIRNNFTKFTKEVWLEEITNSLTGTLFYNKWKEVFELQEIYDEIKNKYDVIYKEQKIEKNNKINKGILFALVVSLLLNIINLIILGRLSF